MIAYLLRYCIQDAVRTAELPNLAAGEGMLDPRAARWVCLGVLVDVIATGRMTAGYYNAEGVLEPVASDADQILEACLVEWGTTADEWPDPFGLWLTCTTKGRAEGRRLIDEIGEWFDEPYEHGDFPRIRDESRSLSHAFSVLQDEGSLSDVSARALSSVLGAQLDVPPQWRDHLLVGFTIDWPLRQRGPLTIVAPTAAASTSTSWGGLALAVGRAAFVAGRLDALSYRFGRDTEEALPPA
jgi:hypothetical protein